MKKVTKILNWIAWISTAMGFIFITMGLIQVALGALRPLFGVLPGDYRLFGDTEVINFFIASTNLFGITIVAILYRWMSDRNA